MVALNTSGLTGGIVPGTVFSPGSGGYGGVIDRNGVLWSSSANGEQLRFVPPVGLSLEPGDWTSLYAAGTVPYGIAVDPLHPYVWRTSGAADTAAEVFRWHTNGTPVTDGSGWPVMYPSDGHRKGLVVDSRGHVWTGEHLNFWRGRR